MKSSFMILFVFFSSICLGEIKIKILEPLLFSHINSSDFRKDMALGTALIEIYTDNKELDLGKKIILEFPENVFLTNKRRWIVAEKIFMEEKEKEFILEKERHQIKIYALLDRNSLNRDENIKDIEGEYVGYIPIIISQYSKVKTNEEKLQ